MNRKKRIIYILLVLLVIAIVGGFYGYKEFNRKNESLTDATPAFKVKSTDLISEFAADEKAANTKYLGKVVQVAGIVKKLDKDDKGFYTVVLGDTSSMSSVRCSVDSLFTAEITSVKPNAPVFMKGICTGYMADDLGIGADVILNRCVLVKD